ncbi:hypothetical protein [Actinoplanes sp. M2I2]|uniref:hypothetical protein n=1 Tax=Actinoplanes sp. M2I2 TaxID=1734444 RepID=UPI00202169E0|nr:hypothetical protein [Actinoplanes sp. M2I2]
MRRPVLYIAGLFLATGASLAFAGPAAAAVSHHGQTSSVAHSPFGDGDDYDFDYRSSSYDLDYSDNNDSYHQFALLNILSPNGQGNTGLGLLGR